MNLPIETLPFILLLSIIVTTILLGRWLRRRDKPQRYRQFYLGICLSNTLLLGAFVVQFWWFGSRLNVSTGILIGAMALSTIQYLYLAFRRRTPREVLLNYAADTTRCGQCDYDLTGNVSGICPECGWRIPPEPPRVERPGWVFWWQGWDIDYLENWKKSLTNMVIICLMFIALSGWGAYRGYMGVFVIGGVMAAHFAINLVRVIAYAVRVRRNPSEARTEA